MVRGTVTGNFPEWTASPNNILATALSPNSLSSQQSRIASACFAKVLMDKVRRCFKTTTTGLPNFLSSSNSSSWKLTGSMLSLSPSAPAKKASFEVNSSPPTKRKTRSALRSVLTIFWIPFYILLLELALPLSLRHRLNCIPFQKWRKNGYPQFR